jgi:bifunctional DNA-binding transcriptional regulator/antitoxin component of YhaV-PrlF toxin-antitoxin module
MAEPLYTTSVSFSIMMVIHLSLTKTRKVGGSLVVTLPKELVESKKIKEGEIVEINVKKVRKDGFGVFKNLTPFTAKDELTAHE